MKFARDALSSDRGKGVYVYLHADGIDGWHAKLEKLGIKAATLPRDWPWGNREFVVKDPNGYKLCFW